MVNKPDDKTIKIKETTHKRLKRLGDMDDTMDSVIVKALDALEKVKKR
jgi:hypothetical protein